MWDRIGPFVIIFLGVVFLMDNFGVPFIDFGDIVKLWPLILIWIGWDMLRGGRKDKKTPPQ